MWGKEKTNFHSIVKTLYTTTSANLHTNNYKKKKKKKLLLLDSEEDTRRWHSCSAIMLLSESQSSSWDAWWFSIKLTKLLVYVIILSIICCVTYNTIIKPNPSSSRCFQNTVHPRCAVCRQQISAITVIRGFVSSYAYYRLKWASTHVCKQTWWTNNQTICGWWREKRWVYRKCCFPWTM